MTAPSSTPMAHESVSEAAGSAAIRRRDASLLLATMLGTPALLRAWLYVTPNADLMVRGVNVHHLFTGVLLTTLAAIPLALSSSGAAMRRLHVACLGAGLGLMLDEWVYLVVTDGSNASYLLPVSGWGAVVLLGLGSLYAIGCHARAAR
jgi:hypothetical protein